MKRKIFMFTFLAIIVLFFYTNEYLKIEYNITLLEYINLSSGFNEEEIAILEEFDVLVYGGNINEPPLGIYYEDNKQYIGLVVDYINALSIELGTTIVSKPMVWNDALISLKEEKTDICDMIPSKERGKEYSFSDPLYDLRGVAVVPNSEKNIKSIEDLEGKRISVQKGDYAIECLSLKGLNAELFMTNDLAEALQLLYNDEVDAVIGDEPVIWYNLNELSNREDYKILDEPLYNEVVVLAVPHSKEALIPLLNKAIFNLRRKDILNQIHMKWLGPKSNIYSNKEEAKLRLNIYVLGVVIIVGGTLIYLWNRSLKVLVVARTRELSTTKDELQIVFDSMANYLVVIGYEGKVYNSNDAFANFLGKSKSGINNLSFYDIPILNSLNNQYMDKNNSEKIETNSILLREEEYKFDFKFDGKVYVVEMYPLKGRHTTGESLLIMLSDVTKSRIQDQKLSHSNKMAAIGQLAMGVAHELRNPLGVIRNSTFILDNTDEKEKEHRILALNSINSAVKRASGIIDNLLTFSRLTNDQLVVCNVNEIIYEITRYYQKSFREKKIKLDYNHSKKIVLKINQESLKHIVINLIQNAIDSMNSGGVIKIDCCETEKTVVISISDEGMGISDDLKERIFEPFFTTKPIGKGTGLGLYITYSEVQKINGEIKVVSNPISGTTFIVDIPKGRDIYE